MVSVFFTGIQLHFASRLATVHDCVKNIAPDKMYNNTSLCKIPKILLKSTYCTYRWSIELTRESLQAFN